MNWGSGGQTHSQVNELGQWLSELGQWQWMPDSFTNELTGAGEAREGNSQVSELGQRRPDSFTSE